MTKYGVAFIGILVSLCCSVTKAQNPRTHLVVQTINGVKIAYALEEKPTVTFTDSDLVIKTNMMEFNYPLDNLARITYGANVNSDIVNLQTDETSVKFDGETLLFSNLKENSTITIHSISGILILNKNVHTKCEYAFSISNLAPGVYIVNVNGLSYKIVKR